MDRVKQFVGLLFAMVFMLTLPLAVEAKSIEMVGANWTEYYYPGWNKLDAAFGPYGKQPKAWLFRGGEVIRYDVTDKHADKGYPKKLTKEFPGLEFKDGVDAAFSRGDTAWFFRGNLYVKYDLSSHKPIHKAKPISSAWKKMEFKDGIDAAFSSGKYAYFFKGDRFQKYNLEKKVAAYKPHPISSAWKNLPFASNVDAAFDYGDGYARFFKGSAWSAYDIANQVARDSVAYPMSSAWRGVSRPMAITTVTVNVYKLKIGGNGVAPLWHSGVVINNKEYSFDDTGEVRTCKPGKFGHGKHHRTIVREVFKDSDYVQDVFDKHRSEWEGSRYSLTQHNCNLFVEGFLAKLGVEGLDREYLDCSGLAKFLRQMPIAVAEELLKQANLGEIRGKELEEAIREDVARLRRLPNDMKEEANRAGKTISDEVKRGLGSLGL